MGGPKYLINIINERADCWQRKIRRNDNWVNERTCSFTYKKLLFNYRNWFQNNSEQWWSNMIKQSVYYKKVHSREMGKLLTTENLSS